MNSAQPQMQLRIEYEPTSFLFVAYTPIDPGGSILEEWTGRWRPSLEDVPQPLSDKLRRLFQIVETRLPERPVTLPDGRTITSGRPSLTRITIWEQAPDEIQAYIGPSNFLGLAGTVRTQDLSAESRRLYLDILASIEAECWKDLTGWLGMQEPHTRGIPVFISYRFRSEIETFAENLATRLSTEGIRPLFDKWEILAGDSVPGKIEEFFNDSEACVIILSKDFKEGKWATQEMRTAITKRIQEGYRVIPVIYESGYIPALVNDARYVDFTSRDEESFEKGVREILQAILGITRRPFG